MFNQDCCCQKNAFQSKFHRTIDDFYNLRNCCPALQLTIPDDHLERHRKFVSARPDNAHHCSIPFKAFQNGCLADFTEPIHRFAIDNNKTLTKQYISDLREIWFQAADESSRYEKSRNYLSRLAELNFAQWLEDEKWKITDLEMYGGIFDVEGFQNNDQPTSFEIKYLGKREVVFTSTLIKNTVLNPCSSSLGLYSPIDYLLFRIYEASRQLQQARTKKIAVAIVEDYDLSFRLPLEDDWINWKNPTFLKRDSEIQEFLNGKYADNPNLDSDVAASVSTLDEIWIMRYSREYKLCREHQIAIP